MGQMSPAEVCAPEGKTPVERLLSCSLTRIREAPSRRSKSSSIRPVSARIRRGFRGIVDHCHRRFSSQHPHLIPKCVTPKQTLIPWASVGTLQLFSPSCGLIESVTLLRGPVIETTWGEQERGPQGDRGKRSRNSSYGWGEDPRNQTMLLDHTPN